MTLPSMVCCGGCKLPDEELIMLVTGLFDDTVDGFGWDIEVCWLLVHCLSTVSMEDVEEFVDINTDDAAVTELLIVGIVATDVQVLQSELSLAILLVTFLISVWIADICRNPTDFPKLLFVLFTNLWEGSVLVIEVCIFCCKGVCDIEGSTDVTIWAVAKGTDKFVNADGGRDGSWFGAKRTIFPATRTQM